MKIAVLFALMLSCVTVYGYVDMTSDEFIDSLMADIGELETVDQAIEVLKTLNAVSRIIDEGEKEAHEVMGSKKRFIGFIKDAFNKVKDAVKSLASKVADFLKDKLSLDKAVDKLLPYITGGETVEQCKAFLVSAATTILGPAAPLVGSVGGIVCEKAIELFAKLAG